MFQGLQNGAGMGLSVNCRLWTQMSEDKVILCLLEWLPETVCSPLFDVGLIFGGLIRYGFGGRSELCWQPPFVSRQSKYFEKQAEIEMGITQQTTTNKNSGLACLLVRPTHNCGVEDLLQ